MTKTKADEIEVSLEGCVLQHPQVPGRGRRHPARSHHRGDWRARRRHHRPSGGRSPFWPPRRASRSGRSSARPECSFWCNRTNSHRHGWHGNALLVRGEPDILQPIAPEAAGRRASRSDRRRTGSRRRGVSRYCGPSRVASSFTAGSGQRADDRLPGSAADADHFAWRSQRVAPARAVCVPRARADVRRRAANSQLSFAPAHFRARPDSRLADGFIADLAVHDSPLARQSSDHLPLTARANLRAAMPAEKAAA